MKRHKINAKKILIGLVLLPIILGIVFIVLNILSPKTLKFPNVLDIYYDLFNSLGDKEVLNAIYVTIEYVSISGIISILIGITLSFLLNINKRVLQAFEPTIDFIRSIPITFFIPAFAILMGVSSPNIIWILAVIPSSLMILVNVSFGLTQQNKNRLHQYQLILGKKSKIKSFYKVTVFEVLPYFISGFKIALSYSIVIVTVLEYMNMGNQKGLGTLVYEQMEQLNYVRVYSIIILVGLIGYLLNISLSVIFKKYSINEK